MLKNTAFSLSFAALAVVLSGCSLYAKPEGVPAMPLQNKLTGDGENFSAMSDPQGRWWEYFDDPVLNELIDQARRQNHDVHEALANVNAARALRGFERWQYLPSGGLSLTGEKRRFSEVEAENPGITETVRGGITTAWEIDLFGRIRNGNRIADASLLSSEAALSAAQLLVVSEVTAAYHQGRASQDKVRLLTQAREHQHDVAELTRSLVQEQREAADALDQALAQLAVDEIALLREQEQLAVYENRLAVLLGQQAGYWRIPPAAKEFAPLRFEVIPTGDLSALLRRRPDIRMAEQSLIARQAAIGLARADYFPRLTLSGFFGFAAGSGGDLGEKGSESWSIGPALHWSMLDFGRTANQVKAGEARADAAAAAYRRTVLQAIEESENALLRYGTAQRELGLRESQRRYSRSAADAAQARYEEGLGTYLAALLAKRDALAAEIARADGIAGHRLATVDVYKALGVAPQ